MGAATSWRIGLEIDKGAIEIGKYDVRSHDLVFERSLISGPYRYCVEVKGVVASCEEGIQIELG